ncbi:MAG: DctP family TRAP transporter solute-binding subunit [Desulfarculaceae bacterium]|jgi:tripartite ATP-independent transporter DctP family solute receptor
MTGKAKLLSLAAIAVTLFLTWGQTATAKVVIKCATATQPSHIYNLGIKYMVKIAAEKSGGELEIQLFPAGQLGSERDAAEGLQLGTLEMTLTSTGPLGSFVPQVKAFNLPFLFKDRQSCYQVLDGPVGNNIAGLFPRIGLRSLGWFENGFRNVTNSKRPINKPQDMKGLKIRVMEDDLFLAAMKALGAAPLPMAWGEVYTSLEQKAIDAQENPLAVIYSSRLFEVQKYLAMTGHFYSPAMLLVSEKFFQGLSPKHQEQLKQVAQEARDYERELSRDADQMLEAQLKKKGMQITHPDKSPFVKAVSSLYTDHKVLKAIGGGDSAKGGALVQAVRAAAK